MADPTVVCRSCGASSTHGPEDPMALCPYCGVALPITREVREAGDALRRARQAEPTGVRRPEPLWAVGEDATPPRRAGVLAMLVVFVAVAVCAAAAVWGLERVGGWRGLEEWLTGGGPPTLVDGGAAPTPP